MAIRDRSSERNSERNRERATPGKGRTGKENSRGRVTEGLSGMLPESFGSALEGLLGFASDMSGQAKTRAQGELERLAQRLDLVTRREFEAVRAIAIAAREQAERLERQLSGKKAPVNTAAKTKTGVKKPTPKTKTKAAAKPVLKKPVRQTLKRR